MCRVATYCLPSNESGCSLFHTRVISATMSEAPYVLDGLHHHTHQTDLRIAEHYTDTAGATDHVFGLCHLLGYRFAPRVKRSRTDWAKSGRDLLLTKLTGTSFVGV